MATTPRQRGTRTDITGDDERDTLTPMQEPLGSMDNPGSRTSSINEVNLPPGETVRRTGNLGTVNTPGTSSTSSTSAARSGSRSFTATFAIAAVVLLAAFLIAIYLGSNRSDVATTGTTQAPVADSNTGASGSSDTTGSTTVAPSQQTAPGTGDAGGTTTGGTATPPANP